MNIDEYRAMKAQQEEPANAQADQEPTGTVEEGVATPGEEAGVPEGERTETGTPAVPESIDIDGELVPIDELKNGYLRQSDYTRKTQELARVKRDLEQAEKLYSALQQDEEKGRRIADELGVEFVSPEQQEIQQMRMDYEVLLIERDLEKMHAQYGDFDERSVIEIAMEKDVSLEDAYILATKTNETSQALDVDTLKEQIRQELLAELQSTVDTGSLITGQTSQQNVQSTEPTLTAQQLKIAQQFKMTPTEYAKWLSQK